MFTAAVGHSEEADVTTVVEELVDQYRTRLSGTAPNAGLLFAAIDFDHQALLCEIHRALPGIELIGCTTDGEISSELGFREDSAALLPFASDTVDITAGVGRDLTAEGQSMTATLQEAIGPDTPIFGALAGDQWRPKHTKQFCGTEVLSDSIPVLLLCGDLCLPYGVAYGWHQVGDVGRVTRAAGATVYEIDGGPAIDFYRKYLGPGAKPTVELPLAILNERDAIDYLRASWGTVDDDTGAVTFLGAGPDGARVRLTIADRDAILNGCAESLSIAASNLPEGAQPPAALFFSCCARKLLLGTRTEEDLGLTRRKLDGAVPVCGFYGYGEISPHMEDPTGSKYHNESFVSLLIAG